MSSSAISPAGEATALKEIGVVDEVVVLEPGQSVWEAVAAKLRAAGPQRIAVNSGGDPVSDGLSWTQRVSSRRLWARSGRRASSPPRTSSSSGSR